MITKVTTDVKRVTRTYHFESLAKVTTMMQLTGPSIEQLDALFEILNQSWIAEVSESFADDRFESLRNWCDDRDTWHNIKGCEVEGADLDLDVVEPEPGPEAQVVYSVEYKEHGEYKEFKVFKTLEEAEQFADEFRMECMNEKELADMKAQGLDSREYCHGLDSCSLYHDRREIATAYIYAHKL